MFYLDIVNVIRTIAIYSYEGKTTGKTGEGIFLIPDSGFPMIKKIDGKIGIKIGTVPSS